MEKEGEVTEFKREPGKLSIPASQQEADPGTVSSIKWRHRPWSYSASDNE